MKRLFAVSALILAVATVLNSCSGGGGSSGFLPTTNNGSDGNNVPAFISTTTTISGTVLLSSTVSAKPSSGGTYTVAASGSIMDKVLTAAGVKQAVSMPPLINAAMKLYNADRPDWIYPVSQVFTDSLGKYKFDVLMNADLNGNEYTNGDPIPSGNYTVIATNDTTVSGGKQLVAVQTLVKRFEGDQVGNDLVVQDSDAQPSIVFMLGLKPNSDGTFGGATTTLAPNAGIQIVFNMAMARLSVINAVKLYLSSDLTNPVAGTWKFTPDLQTATFYPTGGLTANTDYIVKVAGGVANTSAAVNVYGKPLPANIFAYFTAEALDDTTPPQNLILYKPAQTNVPVTTPIQIASPEPLDINSITVTGTPSIGDKPMVLYIGTKTITIVNPADYYIYEIGHTPFKLNTNYNITISNVVDMAGNQISPLSFIFKTETSTNGVTPSAGSTQDAQLAVKDVFGKWVNAMETRNDGLLTTYMTGAFYWVPNGWSPDDLNHDGRLNLNEFRSMLKKMFADFDHCETTITGDAESSYEINLFDPTKPTIKFHLVFNHALASAGTDQICQNLGTGTGVMKADMEYINSAWLISKGADDGSSIGYPPILDVIELNAPGKGITFPEPTPSKPLLPDFVWTALEGSAASANGITTYALIITDAASSDTGWVGLIDGAALSQGDQMTFTYTPDTGCINPSDGTLPCMQYVMASGSVLGFANSITDLIPGNAYYWSVIGFRTATIADFDAGTVTDPASDLGASSLPFNFSVANNVGPSVIAKNPDNGATNVPIDLATITAIFSEDMDGATINDTTFLLSDNNGNPVAGSVTYDDGTRTATFTIPGGSLTYSTTYNVRITTGVTDIALNAMAIDVPWIFSTEQAPDTTAPTTTANPTGRSSKTKPLTIALTTDDPFAKTYFTTDGTDPDTNSTQYQSQIIIEDEGTTVLKFFSVDNATTPNQENIKTETYIIDSIAPTTTATLIGGTCNAANYCSTASIQVSLTPDDGTAKVYFTLDGTTPDIDSTGTPTGTTAEYSVPVDIGGTDDTYKLKFFAADPIGNKETVQTKEYTIDTAIPDTSIESGPSGKTKAPTANFLFTSTEQGNTFECKVDAGSWISCTSPQSFTLTEGNHTFNVRALDLAGNVDPTPATYPWTIDNTPPGGTITINGTAASGDPAYTQTNTTSLDITVSDAVTTSTDISMQLSKDGAFWTDPAVFSVTVNPWTYPDIEGELKAFVRFIDEAGNVSPAYSSSITYDKTAPNTVIESGPPVNTAGRTGSTTATFSFSSTEIGSTFECSIDQGASWTLCTSPKTYSGLANADHYFRVRAIDKAGNVDATPEIFTTAAGQYWTVDTNLLTTAMSVAQTPSAAGKYNTDVNVTLATTRIDGSCGVSTITLKYCIDGVSACNPDAGTLVTGSLGTPPSTTFSLTIPASTQSVKTIRFRSVEGGSSPCNEAEDIQVQSFDIDKVLPTVTLDSGPTAGSYTSSNSATFQFHTSEAVTGYDCSLNNGSTWSACTSPATYNGLTDATRTFAVRAKDLANNIGNWTTRSWTVDTTPPVGNIVGSTGNYGITINDGATYSQSGTVTLKVNASDLNGVVSFDVSNNNFASWSTYSPYASWTTVPNWPLSSGDGDRYIYVRFKDAAGNVSATYSDYIKVDTANPDTYFNTTPTATTSSYNNTFTFSATEGASRFDCYYTYRVVNDANGDNWYYNSGWYACSSPRYLNNWLDGTYTFKVYATDYAGRIDTSPASYTWTIFSGYWDSGRWDYSHWGN